MNQTRKLYVGIDVHSREHKVALLPMTVLECTGTPWKNAKLLNIRNDACDFQRLYTTISSYASNSEDVAIAVDSIPSKPLLSRISLGLG